MASLLLVGCSNANGADGAGGSSSTRVVGSDTTISAVAGTGAPETTAIDATVPAMADVEGPGLLVDATVEMGIDSTLVGIRGHAVAAADVNADGWDDLFVGTFADRPAETYEVRGASGPAPDRLLLGSPTGFVIDERFDGRLGRTAGAVFDDLDNDGDPDLVVSRNVRDSDRGRAPSEIYRNDGGALVPASVLDETRGGRAIGIVDFDGDGLRDIVLVEDRWSGGRTGLFRNEGDLEFTEVTADLGFPDDVHGLGVGIGDLNDDGIDDLVVGGSNRWFLGDGSSFVEGGGSPLPWLLHGDEDDPAHVRLADIDDDGLLDIFIGQHFNSTVDDGKNEPVRLFLNTGLDGSGTPAFLDATEAVGLPALGTKSPQLVLIDLSGDSVRDVITTASYGNGTDRVPVVAMSTGTVSGRPTFEAVVEGPIGPHYWIDAATLDANSDGRTDVFMVEWDPALGSRLFLNLPVADR